MTVQLLQANVRLGESIFLVRSDGSQLEVSPSSASPGATFYQTIQNSDGVPQPQEAALQVINGTLADAPGKTVLTLNYQQIIDSDGGVAAVEPALQFGPNIAVVDEPGFATRINLTRQQLPNVTALDNTSVLLVSGGVWGTFALPGFRATYYVDPSFVGVSSGSASNPFTTIAAAFAAAIAQGLTGALIYLPPFSNVVENVVFPATGAAWEIACQQEFDGNGNSARLTGTVTCDTAASTFTSYTLSNLRITGAISGSNTGSGTPFLQLRACRHDSTLTLTASTTQYVCSFTGLGQAVDANSLGGTSVGAVSVQGGVLAAHWNFRAAVSWIPGTGPVGTFDTCRFANGALGISGAVASSNFLACTFVVATTFTCATNQTINFDAESYASLLAVGGAFAGAGAVTTKTLNANSSSTTTDANNRASTALGARAPTALYELVFSATLLVAGTVGALQVNAIYTDMTGTLVTVPVGGTLNIASAVGTKQAGSLPFQHNGAAAPIAFSTTGIVTPGTMSVALAVALRRVN